MYTGFYGLDEPPFELTPNPRFLYLTPRHREALSNLEYGLSAPKPLTLLVGDAGTGKTTLLRAALASERCAGVRCVVVSNPVLTRGEFVTLMARAFGLAADAATSKGVFLSLLEPLLADRMAHGEMTALVVDEAQSLPAEILEEIRLLSNFETRDARLLPVVLAGQPEITARLNDPALRQLKQRIALRCQIVPFDLAGTAAYIEHRLAVAGGDAAQLFTRDAVEAVHRHAHGTPRVISVVCDNAMVSGFALRRKPIDRELVLEVCRDFDLHPAQTTAGSAAAHAAPRAAAPSVVAPDADRRGRQRTTILGLES